MSVITGTAKKFDGTAIDYVSLFNWDDGTCVAQITPNSNGVWSYNYYNYLTIGITYVADGCQPVTHGSYRFVPEPQTATKGFVVLTYTTSGDRAAPQLNVKNTILSEWANNFAQTQNFGFFDYLHADSTSIVVPPKKKQMRFDTRWVLELTAFSDSTNYLHENISFLDEDDELVFQLVISSLVGSAATNIQYGIGSLSFAPQVGSSQIYPLGDLSFSATQVIFTNKKSDNYIGSFSFDVDVARIKSAVVTYEASINEVNTESGAWLKILNRV